MSNLACFATGSRNLAISICRSGRFEVKKAKRPRCLSPAGPPPPSRLHRTGQRRQLVDALNATLAVETDASVTTITHMVHTGQDLRRRIMIGSLIAFVWTSFAATFVLVMKLIRLGSHTGFAPLCGPVLLFAILGAMLGLVTLSPVDARSIRLAFGVCTAYAYIWGMLFFMIGLATAASCETAHELKCAYWAFWWFAIAVIDWALASWLIWKRMREPSTVSAAQYPSHWHDVAGSAHIGLPAGATCVIISLVSNALYDPYLDGWRFGRGFILDAEEKDSTR